MAGGLISASGAVVFRGTPNDREVLVVHRPAYDDWSLPKGKVSSDEYLAVAAVREVAEETGYRVRLFQHLSPTRYQVAGRPKIVHWWLAEALDEHPATWTVRPTLWSGGWCSAPLRNSAIAMTPRPSSRRCAPDPDPGPGWSGTPRR